MRTLANADFVHMLPVPWQHFVVLLTPPADEAQLEIYIGQRFTQVLDAMFSAEDDLAKLTDAPPRRGLPSFNILVTKQALHVIPRRREDFDLRTTEWAPFASGDAPEGTGTVSVNALGTFFSLMQGTRACYLRGTSRSSRRSAPRAMRVLRTSCSRPARLFR